MDLNILGLVLAIVYFALGADQPFLGLGLLQVSLDFGVLYINSQLAKGDRGYLAVALGERGYDSLQGEALVVGLLVNPYVRSALFCIGAVGPGHGVVRESQTRRQDRHQNRFEPSVHP